MKKLILLAAVACVAAVTTARAQRVYKDGDAIVLDLSVEAGMPAELVTYQPKQFPSTNPSDTYIWTDDNVQGNSTKSTLNQTVYHKLEIAPNNSGEMSWANAVGWCRAYKVNGRTGWRLPTIRELMYIWIVREAVTGLGGEPFYQYGNWATTEFSATIAYAKDHQKPGSTAATKTYNRWAARCVRELP